MCVCVCLYVKNKRMRSRNNKSVFYYTKDFENLPCTVRCFLLHYYRFFINIKKMLVVRNEKNKKKLNGCDDDDATIAHVHKH